MDSSINHSYFHQNSQLNPVLLRFRSAPSSLLGNFNDNAVNSDDSVLNFQEFEEKPLARVREPAVNDYVNSPRSYSGLPPHYPWQSSAATSSAVDTSYNLIGSMASGHREQAKVVDIGLARQNSSPTGIFGNVSVQNGYAAMKDMGSYAGANGANGELSPRFKSQLSFSSRVPSSSGMLLQISEIASEGIETGSPDSGKLGNGYGSSRFHGSPGFPYGSRNESSLGETFSGMRRYPNNNKKLFTNTQNGEFGNRTHMLSHHLSLPKTSVEMDAMDKFLHFQDTVPCKVRAKRGCATHPRSIAERVRRTRISERMRKLQDLVPNMDKQTNTADMLDLAVEYIKALQRQYKALSDSRANCKCSSRQKPAQNQIFSHASVQKNNGRKDIGSSYHASFS